MAKNRKTEAKKRARRERRLERRAQRSPFASTASTAVRATRAHEPIRCDRCLADHVSPLVSLDGWRVERDLFVRNCSGCNALLLTMAASSSPLGAEVEALEELVARFAELVVAAIASERATGNRSSNEVYAQLEELADACEQRGLELAARADIVSAARIKGEMDRFFTIVENMHAAGLIGTSCATHHRA
jgi:hypothetical protein